MSKMKKSFVLLLVLALFALAFAGCGGDATDDTGDAATEVIIGLNYELSGGVASYGQSSVDGINMAFEEINAAGGINGMTIVTVEGDNKSEPAEATSIATKLITQDSVVTILGPATSGAFKAQAPVTEDSQIPAISSSATADDVTLNEDGTVKEYIFRTCFSDSFQGTAMAAFATDNLEAKSAVIIKDNSSDYAKGLATSFTAAFEESGGAIVGEEAYVAKEKDFNAVLTKIKALDYDVIYLPGYYEEVGLIIKQARALGITAPILGADGFDSPLLLELAGADALNDVYFTNHYSSIDEDPAVVAFIAAFQEKYGKEPDAFNALGYDLGMFIADAIERAGSSDPAAIKDALAATDGFVGVTGTISIDENHNAVKSIVVIGLEDGVQATAVKVDPK